MKKFMLLSTVLGAALFAFSANPTLADHHGGKKFEKHDTNGDGVISQAEFMTHAEEKFKKMDLDGNGEVTKEEGKAAREAMKEKRDKK